VGARVDFGNRAFKLPPSAQKPHPQLYEFDFYSVMDLYRDGSSPSHSESLEAVEMQERENDFEGEEGRLLRAGDVEATGDMAYKIEWHLRTGWAIAGSILAAGLVFLGLVLFVRLVIVEDNSKRESLEMTGTRGFRRLASDYILDHT
jgi:hypothetical protein